MRPVEKYSFGYEIARTWVRFTFRFIFYRRWKVRGREKIDPKKPLLFAPNHQNALMDALHVVIMLRAQPIFLARADIFKKKTLARILNWMKIMPVYRIRDGYDSLQKNEEVFEKCAAVLAKGRSLVIFPEGNHGDQRHLRMLKKGLARVAFGAEKARDYKLGLQVVPVGIDYSNYQKFRSRVTLSIGEPISVAQFAETYETDNQAGLKALNAAIRTHLEPHMIEIPWKDEYDGVMAIRDLYGSIYAAKNNKPYKGLFERFNTDKDLIAAIGAALENKPEEMKATCKKAGTYYKLLQRSKLRNHVLAKGPYSIVKQAFNTLLLIISFPFFLYGLINNGLVFFIPDRLSRTLIKDPQFRSSVAYVVGLVLLMPILFILQTLIVSWIFDISWLPWAYFLSLVPTGLLAIHYSFLFKKTRARIGYNLQYGKNPKLQRLIDIREGLLKELEELIA